MPSSRHSNDEKKSQKQLLQELKDLRNRLSAAEKRSASPKSRREAPASSEESLLERRDRFDLLMKKIDIALALVDEQGRLVQVNPAILRLFDLPDQSKIKNVNDRDWGQWRVFTEDGRLLDVDEHPVRHAALTGEAVHDRLVAVGSPASDTLKWMLITAEPILKPDGSVEALLCTYHDISERVHAEKALQVSERRWATTLASIGDAVIAADAAGNVTFLNPTAEALTGWRMEEASGRSVSEVFHIINEHSRAEVENPVARVLACGTVMGLANHTVLLRRDGSEVPIDDSGAPIRDAEGKTTGVVLVFRDISERKRAEKERGYLAAIVEGSSDAIIGKTLEGTITSWNRGAQRLYGYAAEEVIGKPITILHSPGQPDDTKSILGEIRSGRQIEHYETVRQRNDGTQISVSLNVSPIRDPAGQRVIGASTIARDISERKRAERENRCS